MTEVWFRDPANYVRELVECGVGNIAWNRGALVKRRLDLLGWAELHYGKAIPWRMLAVGIQGTAELGVGHDLTNPVAVYPTWAYGDNPAFLEEMVHNPVGKDIEACMDITLPTDERPVYGQEHRVVITEIPKLNTGPGRSFIRWLKVLQEDVPECIMHVHGLYSYKFAFGMGFSAADMEPRTAAANGKIVLAGGYEIDHKRVQKHATWITSMGMKPGELAVPRMRCIFNIRSAIWAGKNYNTLGNMRLMPHGGVDRDTPDVAYKAPTVKLALPTAAKPQPGDKIICNMCSLKLDCKQFREGEVCSLPESQSSSLARFFNTRDGDTIIDGLGVLLSMQAKRLEIASNEEDELGDLNPEVSKMINSLFSQGVQLAKLVDPKLRSAPKVNVGVVVGTGSATGTASMSPSEMTGAVVRALEQQGIPRDKITPQLVMATIQGMHDPGARQHAIEGSVVAEESA